MTVNPQPRILYDSADKTSSIHIFNYGDPSTIGNYFQNCGSRLLPELYFFLLLKRKQCFKKFLVGGSTESISSGFRDPATTFIFPRTDIRGNIYSWKTRL